MNERPLHDRHTPITFSREQMSLIHAAMREGRELPECPNCGERLEMGSPAAAGGTVGPVWQIKCEGCERTAFVTEVVGARRILSDRVLGRKLPEAYVLLDMLPTYRVQYLVARHWPAHAETDRRRLVEALRPLLEPLAGGDVAVTDELRTQCGDVVMAWVETTDLSGETSS
ncbi:MAG TPA: hypothetical protein VGA22_09855 [Gemmatimonadales bacterium]